MLRALAAICGGLSPTGPAVPNDSLRGRTELAALDGAERQDILSALDRFQGRPEPTADRVVRWVVRKPRSTVLLAEVGPSRARVVVKRHHPETGPDPRGARRMARREREYGRLARSPAVEGFTTVELLADYPDLSVQVYRYVPGASLQVTMLREGAFLGPGTSRSLDLIERAGRWLAGYQEAGSRLSTKGSPGQWRDELAGTWAAVFCESRALTAPVPISRLLGWVDRQVGRLGPEELALVPCHGDFGPGNMIVDPSGQVVLIDFASGRPGSRLADAWYFLHQLDNLLFNPLVRRDFVAEAKRRFVRGFGAGRFRSDALCRLERARLLLASLRRYRRRGRWSPSTPYNRWIASTRVRALGRLLADRAGSAILPARLLR